MIVGRRFHGDSDAELMSLQHNYYEEVVASLASAATDQYFFSEALCGVRDELGGRLRDLDGLYDHRDLQETHDLVAAAFRHQQQASPPAPALNPEQHRTRWLAFANAEFAALLRAAPLCRLIVRSIAYHGSAIGTEAQEQLAAALRGRYNDVPFLPPPVPTPASAPPAAAEEDPLRAVFQASLSCLSPVPYAAWYQHMRAQGAHADADQSDEQLRKRWESLLAVPELRVRFEEQKETINRALKERPILPAGSLLVLSESRFVASGPTELTSSRVEQIVAFALLLEPLIGRYGDVKRVAYTHARILVHVRITALPTAQSPERVSRDLATPVRRSQDGCWLVFESPSLNKAVQLLVALCKNTSVTQRNVNDHAALVEEEDGRYRMTPLEFIRERFERGEWSATEPVAPAIQGAPQGVIILSPSGHIAAL